MPKMKFESANHLSTPSNFWPSGPSLPAASGRIRLKSGHGGAAAKRIAHSQLGSMSLILSRRASWESAKMSPLCSMSGQWVDEIAVQASSISHEIRCQMCCCPNTMSAAACAVPQPSKTLRMSHDLCTGCGLGAPGPRYRARRSSGFVVCVFCRFGPGTPSGAGGAPSCP